MGQPQTQRPELGLYGGIFLVKTKGDRSMKLLKIIKKTSETKMGLNWGIY